MTHRVNAAVASCSGDRAKVRAQSKRAHGFDVPMVRIEGQMLDPLTENAGLFSNVALI